jgi:hypothetical protein
MNQEKESFLYEVGGINCPSFYILAHSISDIEQHFKKGNETILQANLLAKESNSYHPYEKDTPKRLLDIRDGKKKDPT